MAKVKNIIISDRVKTNMGGIRVQNPILSKESIDEGTIDETIGLDSSDNPVRGEGGSSGLTEVKVSNIDSESQDGGKAIVSDGDGGAEWHSVSLEYQVENINSISGATIEKLKAGDVVVKKTGNQRHSYRVSYKENGQGICLTYSDASIVETVSYDKVGDDWVYNSTDVTHLLDIPALPSTDGQYTLKLTISSGVAAFEWVSL